MGALSMTRAGCSPGKRIWSALRQRMRAAPLGPKVAQRRLHWAQTMPAVSSVTQLGLLATALLTFRRPALRQGKPDILYSMSRYPTRRGTIGNGLSRWQKNWPGLMITGRTIHSAFGWHHPVRMLGLQAGISLRVSIRAPSTTRAGCSLDRATLLRLKQRMSAPPLGRIAG